MRRIEKYHLKYGRKQTSTNTPHTQRTENGRAQSCLRLVRTHRTLETARKLKQRGVVTDVIADCMGLTEEEVNAL